MLKLSYLMILLCCLSFTQAQTSDWPLTTRHDAKPAGYFKTDIQKKWKQQLDAHFKKHGMTPEKLLTYDVTKLKAKVSIPAGFRNNKKWGLLIHVNSGNNAPLPKDWLPILKKHRLVYAAPYQAGNNVDPLQRVAVTLDTLATLKKKIKFDEKRIYISGLSGGGMMAAFTGFHYQEIFTGIIVHARNVMLEPVPISKEAFGRIPTNQKWQKGMVWPSEFPNLTPKDYAALAKAKYPILFVSGEKDYNYEPILRSAKGYLKHGFDMQIIDVPGMGHTTGNGKALDAALMYMLKGKRSDKFLPRYKSLNIPEPKAKK